MSRPGGQLQPVSARVLGILFLAAILGGCVSDGDRAETTPSPILTGSIPVSPSGEEAVSDQDVVQAAISRTAADGTVGAGIPWANPATGTTGVISNVVEASVDGRTCRRFQTSRHSFDGVAIYVGQACRSQDAAWQLIEFRPKRGSDALPPGDGTRAATG